MKLENPQVRDLIAAEYVLGTLAGGARRRFEKMLWNDANLRLLVEKWSNKIDTLAAGITPVTPPTHVFTAIKKRLNLTAPTDRTEAETPASGWGKLAFWRSATALAVAASFVLALYVSVYLPKPEPAPVYVAVLNNEAAQSSWIIKTNVEARELSIETVSPQYITAEKAFELWLLPANKTAPISVGLVQNQGVTTLTLPSELSVEFIKTAGLAISLEPTGGSPTGLPTGPVLYQGKLQLL